MDKAELMVAVCTGPRNRLDSTNRPSNDRSPECPQDFSQSGLRSQNGKRPNYKKVFAAVLIVFDLDQTLVDTSHLEHLRNTKQWPTVFRRMLEVEAYPGIDDLLKELAELEHQLAIVTHSPRRCAEVVASARGWPISNQLMIGFHDMKKRKPDPSCLDIVMNRVGFVPDEVVHIGDRAHDTQASHAAGVISVGAAWGAGDVEALVASCPDHLVYQVSDLRRILLSM